MNPILRRDAEEWLAKRMIPAEDNPIPDHVAEYLAERRAEEESAAHRIAELRRGIDAMAEEVSRVQLLLSVIEHDSPEAYRQAFAKIKNDPGATARLS